MKKISLSNGSSKAFCVAGDIAVLAAVALLAFFLRATPLYFWGVVITGIIVFCFLALYTYVIFASAVIYDEKQKTLTLKLTREIDFDASGVKYVYTREEQQNSKAVRVIGFSNEKGEELFDLPTMVTFNRGVKSEIIASQIADAMGREFVATVDKAEYDREARKEKEEKARQSIKAQKEEKRLKKLAKKQGIEYVAPPAENKEEAPQINYDEQDDQKLNNK